MSAAPLIGPRDFDPFRTDITECYCRTCREVDYAASDVLDFSGDRHRAAAEQLLAVLRAGEHSRVTFTAHVAEARAEKEARLAEARANGASAETIAILQRGYVKVSMAPIEGMGLGIGGRIQ